mmetsp:Transcript_8608/g.18585  ORF Transcript_8608/g.18585 Transcript_8608/m.18585 type:complete len:462 (+) Transcript_8608:92-1477(+)
MIVQTRLKESIGKVKCLHVFLGLLTTIASVNTLVKAECLAFGCSLTAVDILYDESAREALSVLRQTQPQKSNDDVKSDEKHANDEKLLVTRNEALSKLELAGDGSKTTLTLRGFKGGKSEDQINQDRAMVVSPLDIHPDSSKSKPIAQLLGVFDGHGRGGEKTSQYALKHTPSLLTTKLTAIFMNGDGSEMRQQKNDNSEINSAVVKALKETFNEVDKNDPTQGNAGCTATVVLRVGQKLFIANSGDSVSFIGVYFGGKSAPTTIQKQVQIVYQSREDKPDLPEEKARIVAAGGYVHIPPNDNGDVPRAYFIDENGQPRYGLAMSRSLGDWKVKGVIAEPIVDILDLDEIVQTALVRYAQTCSNIINSEEMNDETNGQSDVLDRNDIHIFATSISDGMMDYLSPHDIGEMLAPAFFDQESGLHPHSAAADLIINAAKGWEGEFNGGYRDDIAIASFVVPFR